MEQDYGKGIGRNRAAGFAGKVALAANCVYRMHAIMTEQVEGPCQITD